MSSSAPAAQNLRILRHAAGLSQEELAERCGLSERTIRTLEAGRAQRPHRDTLTSIADALELPNAARDDFVASWRQPSRRLDELITGPGPKEALQAEFVRQRSLMTDFALMESVRVDSFRRVVTATHRRTFEVVGEGLDHFFTLRGYSPERTDPDLFHVVDAHNVEVVGAVNISDWSARAWESRFGRELPVGSVHTCQWTYDWASAAREGAGGPLDRDALTVLSRPVRLLYAEVVFDPTALPSRVVQVFQESVNGPQETVRELEVSPFGCAQIHLEPAPSGVHGIRWDWDGDGPG